MSVAMETAAHRNAKIVQAGFESRGGLNPGGFIAVAFSEVCWCYEGFERATHVFCHAVVAGQAATACIVGLCAIVDNQLGLQLSTCGRGPLV